MNSDTKQVLSKTNSDWNQSIQKILPERYVQKIPKALYRKVNPKRFFYPKEWIKFINTITNIEHRFLFEFLLHTGMRIKEAAHVEVRDIDFERESILIKKPKTKGMNAPIPIRTIQISTYLKNKILQEIKRKNLGKTDKLGFKTRAFMIRIMKRHCKAAGIEDYIEFSTHNCRKTLENWLVALNYNLLSIQAHMGHTLQIAAIHYVGNNLFNSEDKILIRSILDNLLNK